MRYTYCLSDVHGEHDKLVSALRLIGNDIIDRKADPATTTIIVLGDNIDRGPHSRACLDTLRQLRDASGAKVRLVRGNHEDLMLKTLRHRSRDHEECWLKHGGLETLSNYLKPGRELGDGKDLHALDRMALDDHLDFIEEMELYVEDDLRVYVHAGVRGSFQYMQFQRDEDLMWMRPKEMELFWPAGLPIEPKLVVHGHTPFWPGLPGQTFGIDGGATFGGHLKLVVFSDEYRDPVHIFEVTNKVLVPANENKVLA